MKHKFTTAFGTIVTDDVYLIGKDICLYCDKNIYDLAINTSYERDRAFRLYVSVNERHHGEWEFNNSNPCISDDEYLIKQIIE